MTSSTIRFPPWAPGFASQLRSARQRQLSRGEAAELARRSFPAKPGATNAWATQGAAVSGGAGTKRKRRRTTLQVRLICAILILVSGSCVSAAESASRVLIAQDDAAKAGQNPRRPDADRDCLAWTDTCVNCRREKPGDSFVCSNIGTSCQPKEVACTSRADPALTNPAPK